MEAGVKGESLYCHHVSKYTVTALERFYIMCFSVGNAFGSQVLGELNTNLKEIMESIDDQLTMVTQSTRLRESNR